MKDDRVYLRHILRCIGRIEEYTTGGREGFLGSHLIQDGVIRNLQTLAESSQHLSDGVKASQRVTENNRRARYYSLTARGRRQLDASWFTGVARPARSPGYSRSRPSRGKPSCNP